MRSTLLIVFVLLCGCVEEKAPVEAVEVPPDVHFSEDFSSGLDGWSISSQGGGSMTVSSHEALGVDAAVEMRSPMFRSVTAEAPAFDLDYDSDYAVSFDLMLPHRENYGFTVFQNRQVKLVLEHGTGIACLDGDEVDFLGRFSNNEWHTISLKVQPEWSEYDVYLDGELKKTCDFHDSDVETFLFGDPDPTDKVYGDGFWDNFKVTDRL